MQNLSYYPTEQLRDIATVAEVILNDDVLGSVRITANVTISMAVEQQLVKRLRELYPEGIGAGEYVGSVADVTCGLMLRHYQTVDYTVVSV